MIRNGGPGPLSFHYSGGSSTPQGLTLKNGTMGTDLWNDRDSPRLLLNFSMGCWLLLILRATTLASKLHAIDKSNTLSYTLLVKAEIAGTLVEWDETKNQRNIKKHGISFQTAALVFADEERIEYFDKLHSQDEERYVILGCVHGILYVVYTMRDECARLISARMATPFERKIYYGEE